MVASDWIAIISALIAIGALTYAIISNTKRFELTDKYREDLLKWFESTTEVLIKLKLFMENEIGTEEDKACLLAKLSTQIEVGRFFFPNVDKGDSFGNYKPHAYRGYRHIVLEFLVISYDIFKMDKNEKYKKHVLELQRQFTSHIFEVLNPESFNQEIQKNADVILNKKWILEDFLDSEPNGFLTRTLY